MQLLGDSPGKDALTILQWGYVTVALDTDLMPGPDEVLAFEQTGPKYSVFFVDMLYLRKALPEKALPFLYGSWKPTLLSRFHRHKYIGHSHYLPRVVAMRQCSSPPPSKACWNRNVVKSLLQRGLVVDLQETCSRGAVPRQRRLFLGIPFISDGSGTLSKTLPNDLKQKFPNSWGEFGTWWLMGRSP